MPVSGGRRLFVVTLLGLAANGANATDRAKSLDIIFEDRYSFSWCITTHYSAVNVWKCHRPNTHAAPRKHVYISECFRIIRRSVSSLQVVVSGSWSNASTNIAYHKINKVSQIKSMPQMSNCDNASIRKIEELKYKKLFNSVISRNSFTLIKFSEIIENKYI